MVLGQIAKKREVVVTFEWNIDKPSHSYCWLSDVGLLSRRFAL